LKILDEAHQKHTQLLTLLIGPRRKSSRELRVSDTLETSSNVLPLIGGFDQHDAAMLRTHLSPGESFGLEHADLAAHSTSVHARRTRQIAHRQWLTVAERTQNVHRLLRELDSCGTGHSDVHAPTGEESAQPSESETDRDELILDGGLRGVRHR
jgi:hypothetical protein